MYTYIMKSHDLYKIGKAIDVNRRIKGFKVGNPDIELVKTIDGNYENHLHKYHKEKRKSGEWFNLNTEDIDNIDIIIKEEKERRESIIEIDKNIDINEDEELTTQVEYCRGNDNWLFERSHIAESIGMRLIDDIMIISLKMKEGLLHYNTIITNGETLSITEKALQYTLKSIEEDIRKIAIIQVDQ